MKKMADNYDGFTEISVKALPTRSIVDKFLFNGQLRISSRMDLNNEDTLCYFLITMGGGITEGEKYLTKIHLGPDSRAVISTQAPTYVYKCENGKISRQFFKIDLDENSTLEYLADNVIPYERSKYEQISEINLKKGASLLYSDGVTSGWSPDDIDFKYDYVHMDTKVRYDGKLMYSDNLILDPKNFEIADLGLYEEYRNYTSLIAIDEQIDEKFVHEMQERFKNVDHCICGISKLEGPGLVVRTLGESIGDNQKVISNAVDYLRGKLFNSPKLNLRKDVALNA